MFLSSYLFLIIKNNVKTRLLSSQPSITYCYKQLRALSYLYFAFLSSP